MSHTANINPPPYEILYNKYLPIRMIGEGHFGEVWLALDQAIQRQFAVKALKPGVPIDRRLREARIGNLLTHDNLVQVHQADVMNISGQEYVLLAMDFFQNGPVTTLANSANFLTLPEVLRIACDILQGLDFLHKRHFYHNDIKPENILLGDKNQAMLSDYGITGISTDGCPVSAPSSYLLHCAPEVYSDGNIGVSTDIFQVGMTLIRLLLGLDHFMDIFNSVGQAEYEKRIKDGRIVTPNDFKGHIPSKVRKIVLQAVHPDPAIRYSSSLQMRREIERLNFPGYWSVDKDGREIGYTKTYSYKFELSRIGKNHFDLLCKKHNLKSGNISRISKHCKKKMTRGEAKKAIEKFKQSVVMGH